MVSGEVRGGRFTLKFGVWTIQHLGVSAIDFGVCVSRMCPRVRVETRLFEYGSGVSHVRDPGEVAAR